MLLLLLPLLLPWGLESVAMIATPPRENPLVAWLRAYALQEVLIGNLSDVPPSHDCVACTRPKASEGGSPFLWEFLPLTNLTPQHPASACNNTNWVHRPLFTCNTTSDDRRPNSFAPVAVTGPLPAAPCIVFFGFSNPTPLGQYPNCTQWFIGPRPNSNPKKGSSRYRTEFTRFINHLSTSTVFNPTQYLSTAQTHVELRQVRAAHLLWMEVDIPPGQKSPQRSSIHDQFLPSSPGQVWLCGNNIARTALPAFPKGVCAIGQLVIKGGGLFHHRCPFFSSPRKRRTATAWERLKSATEMVIGGYIQFNPLSYSLTLQQIRGLSLGLEALTNITAEGLRRTSDALTILANYAEQNRLLIQTILQKDFCVALEDLDPRFKGQCCLRLQPGWNNVSAVADQLSSLAVQIREERKQWDWWQAQWSSWGLGTWAQSIKQWLITMAIVLVAFLLGIAVVKQLIHKVV
ncbi:uncharacterized protein LOC127054507 [Gopherus flavomarginatus]|uniref:uncharacterized protein LOC127054507 n=1 Tax=Gopherus flavomarginatus TaxID=286002 RepID=UPI0021CBD264|nr:uncharacterized protein LOC127054507 [Gopherus flavomarginatus]